MSDRIRQWFLTENPLERSDFDDFVACYLGWTSSVSSREKAGTEASPQIDSSEPRSPSWSKSLASTRKKAARSGVKKRTIEKRAREIGSLRTELDGRLELGMAADVRKLVREILNHRHLDALGFAEAITAIAMSDNIRSWRRLVEAAYDRLSKNQQRLAGENMLAFYFSVKDTTSALRFCSARNLTTAPHLWFGMEVLLEHGKVNEARMLARKLLRLADTVQGRFEAACLADALSSYFLRIRDFAGASQIAYAAPPSLLPRNSALGVVELHLVAAITALDEALANLNQFRQESDPAIGLALHGTKDQIIRENEQALRRLKPCLEALIPKPRRKILGFS